TARIFGGRAIGASRRTAASGSRCALCEAARTAAIARSPPRSSSSIDRGHPGTERSAISSPTTSPSRVRWSCVNVASFIVCLLESNPARRLRERVERNALLGKRLAEARGHVGAPLARLETVNFGGRRIVEQIAVGEVLVNQTPGVAPVIEDLAAERMPRDTPRVPVAFCRE